MKNPDPEEIKKKDKDDAVDEKNNTNCDDEIDAIGKSNHCLNRHYSE